MFDVRRRKGRVTMADIWRYERVGFSKLGLSLVNIANGSETITPQSN
jgi:hypothetical protein